MGQKRKPTPYQRQIRFLTILFGVILIIVVVGILLIVNRPMGGYGH